MVNQSPVSQSPVNQSPGNISHPVTGHPVTGQPITGQPVTSHPVTGQPVTSQPVTSHPVTGQPGTIQPGTSYQSFAYDFQTIYSWLFTSQVPLQNYAPSVSSHVSHGSIRRLPDVHAPGYEHWNVRVPKSSHFFQTNHPIWAWFLSDVRPKCDDWSS